MEFDDKNIGTPVLELIPTTDSPKDKVEEVIVDTTDTTTKTETVETTEVKETEPIDKVNNEVVDVKKVEPKAETTDKEIKDENELEFEFGNDTETKKEEALQETKALTSETVLEFLNNNGFDGIKDLKELSKKEELSEEVEQFKLFQEQTGGRGIKDFYNLHRDWKEEPKDTVLKEYYKWQNPELSDKNIKETVDLLNLTEDDESQMSDTDIRQKRLKYETEYSKAVKFMVGKSNELNTPLDNKAPEQKQLTAKEIAEQNKPYWDNRDKALERFKEVKFTIKGLGEIKVPITDEQKLEIAERTQTNESFFKDWFDKDGNFDVDKTVLNTFYSNEKNVQSLIMSVAKQLNSMLIDKYSKEERNVTLDKPKKDVVPNSQIPKVEIVGGKPNPDANVGRPLF